jgi:hypothetical protein
MGMAHTPECDRASKMFLAPPSSVPLPPLDPRAAAAVALRNLSLLGPTQALITAEESGRLLSPFQSRGHGADLTRLSVMLHGLARLPEDRRTLLQRLVRYLRRLAAFSDTCTAANLAQSVGPALFKPENLRSQGASASGATAAAVQATLFMIK